MKGNSVLVLSIVLYLLLFWLRYIQGGWQVEIDFFKEQRKVLDQKIRVLLASPQAELLSGIVLGEKKELPGQFRLALRDTSTLHIVVVSGQNLSLVAGFVLALSGLIKRQIAISLAFLVIIFYTLLTGVQVPVLRAAIMATLTFSAQIFGRQKDAVWILVVTAGLMLLVNPKWIFDLSFELSFMATLGVVVVAPMLLKYLKALPLIGQDLATTMGAQVLIMPIIAQNFHQISLVGILANLMILWTIPFIMILGVILLILAATSQFLGQLGALVVGVLLTYFIYIVQFFASLPFAWEYVGEKLWIVWVGYYLVLSGVLLGISKLKSQNK